MSHDRGRRGRHPETSNAGNERLDPLAAGSLIRPAIGLLQQHAIGILCLCGAAVVASLIVEFVLSGSGATLIAQVPIQVAAAATFTALLLGDERRYWGLLLAMRTVVRRAPTIAAFAVLLWAAGIVLSIALIAMVRFLINGGPDIETGVPSWAARLFAGAVVTITTWRTILVVPSLLSGGTPLTAAIRSSWTLSRIDAAALVPSIVAIVAIIEAVGSLAPSWIAPLFGAVGVAAIQVAYLGARRSGLPQRSMPTRVASDTAPVDARVFAHAIDLPFVALLVLAASRVIAWLPGESTPMLAGATPALVTFAYLAVTWSSFRATPGQALVGLRLVRASELSLGRAPLARALTIALPLSLALSNLYLALTAAVVWWTFLEASRMFGWKVLDSISGATVTVGRLSDRPEPQSKVILGALGVWTPVALGAGFVIGLADSYGSRGVASPGAQVLLASGLFSGVYLALYSIYRRA